MAGRPGGWARLGNAPDLVGDRAVGEEFSAALILSARLQMSRDIRPEIAAITQPTVLAGGIENAESPALLGFEDTGGQVRRGVGGIEYLPVYRKPPLRKYQAGFPPKIVAFRPERAASADRRVIRPRYGTYDLDSLPASKTLRAGEAASDDGDRAHGDCRQAGYLGASHLSSRD